MFVHHKILRIGPKGLYGVRRAPVPAEGWLPSMCWPEAGLHAINGNNDNLYKTDRVWFCHKTLWIGPKDLCGGYRPLRCQSKTGTPACNCRRPSYMLVKLILEHFNY